MFVEIKLLISVQKTKSLKNIFIIIFIYFILYLYERFIRSYMYILLQIKISGDKN